MLIFVNSRIIIIYRWHITIAYLMNVCFMQNWYFINIYLFVQPYRKKNQHFSTAYFYVFGWGLSFGVYVANVWKMLIKKKIKMEKKWNFKIIFFTFAADDWESKLGWTHFSRLANTPHHISFELYLCLSKVGLSRCNWFADVLQTLLLDRHEEVSPKTPFGHTMGLPSCIIHNCELPCSVVRF